MDWSRGHIQNPVCLIYIHTCTCRRGCFLSHRWVVEREEDCSETMASCIFTVIQFVGNTGKDIHGLLNIATTWEIRNCQNAVPGVSSLMGRYAVSTGKRLPKFRKIVMSSSSRSSSQRCRRYDSPKSQSTWLNITQDEIFGSPLVFRLQLSVFSVYE